MTMGRAEMQISTKYSLEICLKPLHLHPIKFQHKKKHMIVVAVKEGESLEKALKKFKKKFEKTGVVRELRDRQKFTKPSIRKRETKLKAIYKQQLIRSEEV
jgi:small subunit ribosomal protein S21